MNRAILAASLAVAVGLSDTDVNAQVTENQVIRAFEGISGSIVRIRTIADLELEGQDADTHERVVSTRSHSINGTGVVVGEMVVDGRTEYLILTNHHVADASNYLLEEGGFVKMNPSNTLAMPRAHEESYLMEEASDTVSAQDIRLVELVRKVRGDMTLMMTVGSNRRLPVFTGPLGYLAGDVVAGDRIITSGYPRGGDKIVAVGSVLEAGHQHALGVPHYDFIVDMPVEPGQSGSPVFRVERDPGADEPITFRLIGLIHARNRERSYAVPYDIWADTFDQFPEVLQERLVRGAVAAP